MRSRKVRGKILIALLLLLLVVILAMGMTVSHLFQTIFTSQRLEDLHQEALRDAALIGEDLRTERLAELARSGTRGLIVIDREGRLVYQGGQTGGDSSDIRWLPGVEQVLAGQELTVKTTESPRREQMFVTGVPVGMPAKAALFLVEPATSGDQLITRMNRVLLLAVVGALLLAGGGALFIADRMAQPLVRMERVTKRLMQGDFSGKVPIYGSDELAGLGQTLNGLVEHLHRLETTRAEFLSNVSHELRTPLTYIQGYTQILSEGVARTEEEQQNYLRIIEEEVKRLQRLLDDLLDLARFEESRFQMSFAPVDPAQVIGKVIETLRPHAEQQRVVLSYAGPDELPVVEADRIRLEQVLINLIHNALQYAGEGGHVRIIGRCSATQVMVAVEDDGPGIPEAELPYIWERFYRVDKSRNRTLGGTGIGLSIVKRIIEAHGGHIHVASQAGQGTVVSFVLNLRAEGEEGRGVPR